MVSTYTIAAGGLVIGILFGYAAARSNFCTMGAISDVLNMGSWKRMHMWLAGMGIAVLATGVLQLFGLIDTGKSYYAGSNLLWLSHIIGGFTFGIGMTLAGGCANKNLIRVGAGSLRSVLVFLTLALFASMTLTGILGVFRVTYLDAFSLHLSSNQQLPAMLVESTGISMRAAWGIGMFVFGLLPLVFALIYKPFRTAEAVSVAVILGLLIAASWYVTGHIGYVAEDPRTLEEAFIGTNSRRPEGLSYVAPYAAAVSLLVTWSDSSSFVSFGVASMWGVSIGALIYALMSKTFSLETFHNPVDTIRHIVGAALMGFGGVTALGCTVGQGMSGMSVLSIGSLITMLSIVAGCVVMIKWDSR